MGYYIKKIVPIHVMKTNFFKVYKGDINLRLRFPVINKKTKKEIIQMIIYFYIQYYNTKIRNIQMAFNH